MGCGNAVIANDNPFNREVLGSSSLFSLHLNRSAPALHAVDCGEAEIARVKVKVVERVKEYYTWSRITDYYCELISLVGPKSRSRSEIIHGAPVLANEADLDVVSSR